MCCWRKTVESRRQNGPRDGRDVTRGRPLPLMFGKEGVLKVFSVVLKQTVVADRLGVYVAHYRLIAKLQLTGTELLWLRFITKYSQNYSCTRRIPVKVFQDLSGYGKIIDVFSQVFLKLGRATLVNTRQSQFT